MSIYLTLTPRDPLIARDGRPFGSGQRMKSLDWPYPSVLAGSLRSLLGKANGGVFDDKTVAALKQINIEGPLPLFNGELYFPAPRDLLVYADEGKNQRRSLMKLRPLEMPAGSGCNLPFASLRPVGVSKEAKPAKAPAFWSLTHMAHWLAGKELEKFIPPEKAEAGSGFLDTLAKDERMHVSIKPETYAAEEGLLFKTVGLDMGLAGQAAPLQLAVRVAAEGIWHEKLKHLKCLHPLGGERRLAHWQAERSCTAWHCPAALHTALKPAKRVRLVLATPGIFKHGWLPGWLDETSLQGTLPGTSVQLRLLGACIDRWKPISGWGLENGNIGPKPIRRLVPAGSVYFFEVPEACKGSAAELTDNYWLHSVADEAQDRRDGLGLALWGLW